MNLVICNNKVEYVFMEWPLGKFILLHKLRSSSLVSSLRSSLQNLLSILQGCMLKYVQIFRIQMRAEGQGWCIVWISGDFPCWVRFFDFPMNHCLCQKTEEDST